MGENFVQKVALKRSKSSLKRRLKNLFKKWSKRRKKKRLEKAYEVVKRNYMALFRV